MGQIGRQHVKKIFKVIWKLLWSSFSNICSESMINSAVVPFSGGLQEVFVAVVLLAELAEVDFPLGEGVSCLIVCEESWGVKFNVFGSHFSV